MPKNLLITHPTLETLEAFLAQHRTVFGRLRMEDGGDGGDGGGDDNGGGDADDSGDGDDGDEGGKPPAEDPNLVEERTARKNAETILAELLPGKSKAAIRKALKAGTLDTLRPAPPKDDKKTDDDGKAPDVDEIRRNAEATANERANARIVSAEVRALAAELFADPADAPLYLDVTEYDVDDDGNVDAKKIRADLDAVLKRKPHLAKKGTKPKPDKSQGTKTDPASETGHGRRRLAGAYATSTSKS